MLSLPVLAALGVGGVFLLVELYRRVFLDFGDDDTVMTVLEVFGVNRPDFKNLDKLFGCDNEYVIKARAQGKRVVRFVSIFQPWRRTVVIADPNLLREVMVGKDWTKFERIHPNFEYLKDFANMAVMPNGKEWRETRSLFDKAFSTSAVRSYVPIVNNMRDTFIGELEKESRSPANRKDGFDIQELLSKFTFDVILRLAFGRDEDCQRTQRGHRFYEAWLKWGQSCMPLVLMNFLIHQSAWKVIGGPFLKVFNECRAIIWGLVDENVERIRSGADKGTWSIMGTVLEDESKLPEYIRKDETGDELRKQATTILFAGQDTTAHSTAFAMHYLAQNPEWQDKIRAEVKDLVPPGEHLSLEQLESLPALNAVIKEILRMHPVAPQIATRAIFEGFTMQYDDAVTSAPRKVVFSAGDYVLPFVYAAHFDQAFWRDDVHEFNPERWLKDPAGGCSHLYAFAPFGNGARRCLGERLAMGEMRLLVASILRKWLVVPGNYEFAVQQMGSTMRCKYGVNIKLAELKA
ncbi:cytochrome P450 [Hyaloraphidium curvatum]|nr:cytochrome P450 [Hyaloraphidium curvatum]